MGRIIHRLIDDKLHLILAEIVTFVIRRACRLVGARCARSVCLRIHVAGDDIYLLAIDSEGITSKISVIKGVSPFAIAAGDGSKLAPYVVYTKEQLSQISMIPNKFYRLGADITLNGEWTPLPDFTGTLDGNGHAIRGMKVSSKSHAGLFSSVSGTVKNLTVYGDITATKNVGIIAGENDATIENCTVC